MSNSSMLLRTPEDFVKDMGHSSDQELKKNGTERTPTNQTVRGSHVADLMMMINLRESGHPLFRGTSALSSEDL